MPKGSDRTELVLSPDELRELRLALALRITRLAKMDSGKLSPSERAKVRRRLEICNELHETVQTARGR